MIDFAVACMLKAKLLPAISNGTCFKNREWGRQNLQNIRVPPPTFSGFGLFPIGLKDSFDD
jgi:hypothetical protein